MGVQVVRGWIILCCTLALTLVFLSILIVTLNNHKTNRKQKNRNATHVNKHHGAQEEEVKWEASKIARY